VMVVVVVVVAATFCARTANGEPLKFSTRS